eukprot:jgi/Picsp_1/2183/NSC_05648-R1_subunit of golgi mannosyltransferase complex
MESPVRPAGKKFWESIGGESCENQIKESLADSKKQEQYHLEIISAVLKISPDESKQRKFQSLQGSKEILTGARIFEALKCERFQWETLKRTYDAEELCPALKDYDSIFVPENGLSFDNIVNRMNDFAGLLQSQDCMATVRRSACYEFRKETVALASIRKPYKIAILMVAIGYDDQEYAKLSILNKRLYAEKHGYSFHVVDRAPSGSSRHPAWLKYSSVLKLLSSFDFVWTVDVDTVILNMEQRLESIINPVIDMLVGIDPNGWSNTGSFIARSSDWTKMFLMYLWTQDKVGRTNRVWEQGAFEYAINSRMLPKASQANDDHWRLSSHIQFIGQDVFNADINQMIARLPFVLNYHSRSDRGEMIAKIASISNSISITNAKT